MMQTVLALALAATETSDAENLSGPRRHVWNRLANVVLQDGFGSGQADRAFSDSRTLAASANEDVDLVGSITGAFGSAVSPAKLKLLIIDNPSTTQTLTVKAATSNGVAGITGAAAHSITIPPGGCFIWYSPAGITLTAGTGDLWNVANGSGDSVEYDIFGIGTSA